MRQPSDTDKVATRALLCVGTQQLVTNLLTALTSLANDILRLTSHASILPRNAHGDAHSSHVKRPTMASRMLLVVLWFLWTMRLTVWLMMS